jgi:hypothetical protein
MGRPKMDDAVAAATLARGDFLISFFFAITTQIQFRPGNESWPIFSSFKGAGI